MVVRVWHGAKRVSLLSEHRRRGAFIKQNKTAMGVDRVGMSMKISTVVVARAENQRPVIRWFAAFRRGVWFALGPTGKGDLFASQLQDAGEFGANDIHTQPRFQHHQIRRSGSTKRRSTSTGALVSTGSMSSGTVLETWNLSRRKLNFVARFPVMSAASPGRAM
jgi:hypothetical protein